MILNQSKFLNLDFMGYQADDEMDSCKKKTRKRGIACIHFSLYLKTHFKFLASCNSKNTCFF